LAARTKCHYGPTDEGAFFSGSLGCREYIRVGESDKSYLQIKKKFVNKKL
jgi:hypothetical protein